MKMHAQYLSNILRASGQLMREFKKKKEGKNWKRIKKETNEQTVQSPGLIIMDFSFVWFSSFSGFSLYIVRAGYLRVLAHLINTCRIPCVPMPMFIVVCMPLHVNSEHFLNFFCFCWCVCVYIWYGPFSMDSSFIYLVIVLSFFSFSCVFCWHIFFGIDSLIWCLLCIFFFAYVPCSESHIHVIYWAKYALDLSECWITHGWEYHVSTHSHRCVNICECGCVQFHHVFTAMRL